MLELFPYQVEPVNRLLPILQSEHIALLNGDVGTGKTIMALELMRQLKPPAVGVLAPKIVLTAWERAAKEMGVPLAFCINPEIVRTGRRPNVAKKESTKLFQYNLPPGSVVIFDEVHKYGAPDSQMAHLFISARASGCKTLGVTGTLGDSILRFRGILAVAGLVRWNDFFLWALKHGCWRDSNINGHPWRFSKGQVGKRYMGELNSMLFPRFGARLSVADIPDYPKCQTQVDLYDMTDKQKGTINEMYSSLRPEWLHPESAPNELVELLRLRQKIQSEKAVLFADIAQELVEEGNSVAAFFDFTEPLQMFAGLVKKNMGYDVPLIWGQQTREERDQAIARFQSDQSPVIALNSSAGGVGVSLGCERDDSRPRVGLHNLPLSGETLIQSGGRIWRATNKHPSLNKVVLVSGVEVEERVYKLLRGKLHNLATVQGDDVNACMF